MMKHCHSSGNFINRRASTNYEKSRPNLLQNKSVNNYNNITIESKSKPYARFSKKFEEFKKSESRNKVLNRKIAKVNLY